MVENIVTKIRTVLKILLLLLLVVYVFEALKKLFLYKETGTSSYTEKGTAFLPSFTFCLYNNSKSRTPDYGKTLYDIVNPLKPPDPNKIKVSHYIVNLYHQK